MADYTYPEDRTGTRAGNLITGEEHTLTPDNNRNFHFIIPKFAPFYGTSIKVFKSINGTLMPLVEGTDFHLSLEFTSATLSTGKPVYGAISFVDLSLDSNVIIDYRTVGGQWTLDTQEMLQVIANIVFNPRGLTWDQIAGRPESFGPTEHTFDFNNLLTEQQLGDKLIEIRDAILAAGQTNSSHEDRIDNPHNTTAAQLGVGEFYQKGIASVSEAIAGNDPDKLISATVLRAVLEQLGVLGLSDTVHLMNEHINSINNPHDTLAQHLDLDLVENLEVANLSEIISKRKVKKYVTLDNLIDYIGIHGCATSDEEQKRYPVKDSLLSSYCKVRDNMGIYADGYGGTYERIIENNSPVCGYVPPPSSPQYPAKGTILTRYCVEYEQHGLYADGYGGTYANLIAINSPACGYSGENTSTTYPAAGTVLGQYCDGSTQVQTKANGSGGSYEDRVPNSPNCQSGSNHPPLGTLLSTYCSGYNQMGRYADGQGGTYNAVVQANSAECGWQPITPSPTSPPPPPGTLPPITTPTPTTQPPGVPQIQYSVSATMERPGDPTVLTLNLSGFPPSTSVTVQGWYNALSVPSNGGWTANPVMITNINIDANGNGYYTTVDILESTLFSIFGLPNTTTQLRVQSRWQTNTGVTSNTLTRTLVRDAPVNRTITARSNNPHHKVGDTETITATLSGFAPGTYPVAGYYFSPQYMSSPQYGINPATNSITVGSSGNATFTYTHTITASIFDILGVPSGVNTVSYDNYFVIDGVESNHYDRSNTRTVRTLTLTANRTTVGGGSAVTFTYNLKGANPNKTYNIRFRRRTISSGNTTLETKSVSTNSSGNGSGNFTYYHNGVGGGTYYYWVDMLEHTSTKSNEITIILINEGVGG
jgi:hypothetical protein